MLKFSPKTDHVVSSECKIEVTGLHREYGFTIPLHVKSNGQVAEGRVFAFSPLILHQIIVCTLHCIP